MCQLINLDEKQASIQYDWFTNASFDKAQVIYHIYHALGVTTGTLTTQQTDSQMFHGNGLVTRATAVCRSCDSIL